MFNKKKHKEERQERLVMIMNDVLDVFQQNNVTMSEMSDAIVNMQINYNRMLLDEISKLKKQ